MLARPRETVPGPPQMEDRTISHNTWIHKVARFTVVKPLVGTRVTPNHLTVLRLAFGLAAAASLGIGGSPWQGAGAMLFVLSMLMDRADGDLARVTGQSSPEGHVLDLWADSLCNALILVGLGLGLRDGSHGAWAIPMGLAAGGAVAAVLSMVLKLESQAGARAGEIGGVAGFDPDDAMLAIPVLVWLGYSEELLVAASIGAPAFALLFAVLVFRKKKDVAC